jgi:hypothetical protein
MKLFEIVCKMISNLTFVEIIESSLKSLDLYEIFTFEVSNRSLLNIVPM